MDKWSQSRWPEEEARDSNVDGDREEETDWQSLTGRGTGDSRDCEYLRAWTLEVGRVMFEGSKLRCWGEDPEEKDSLKGDDASNG